MSPDWPTLLGVHEKGVHEGSCCVLSKFTKHRLSLYLLLQFTELLKTPHTRPSASIRKQHGYFRNHTEWLKKQGTFQCLLEAPLGQEQSAVSLFTLQRHRPRGGHTYAKSLCHYGH